MPLLLHIWRAMASLERWQTYGAAGLAGLGLIQAALIGVCRHLESEALVEVLADFRPELLDVSLVVARRHNLSCRVRAFMTWIEEVLTPWLDHTS